MINYIFKAQDLRQIHIDIIGIIKKLNVDDYAIKEKNNEIIISLNNEVKNIDKEFQGLKKKFSGLSIDKNENLNKTIFEYSGIKGKERLQEIKGSKY